MKTNKRPKLQYDLASAVIVFTMLVLIFAAFQASYLYEAADTESRRLRGELKKANARLAEGPMGSLDYFLSNFTDDPGNNWQVSFKLDGVEYLLMRRSDEPNAVFLQPVTDPANREVSRKLPTK